MESSNKQQEFEAAFGRNAHILLKKIESINPNPNGLDDNYTIKGILEQPIRIGGLIMVLRYQRNDIERFGIFTSTRVKSIDGNKITTENSVYEINTLEGDPPRF